MYGQDSPSSVSESLISKKQCYSNKTYCGSKSELGDNPKIVSIFSAKDVWTGLAGSGKSKSE